MLFMCVHTYGLIVAYIIEKKHSYNNDNNYNIYTYIYFCRLLHKNKTYTRTVFKGKHFYNNIAMPIKYTLKDKD